MKELIRVAVLFVWFTHWNCQFACGQEAESTVTNLVVWELVAAAEPRPALQHSFWPALEKYKRGNAIVNYQRAYMHCQRRISQSYARFWRKMMDSMKTVRSGHVGANDSRVVGTSGRFEIGCLLA